jgi:hypothetical protein
MKIFANRSQESLEKNSWVPIAMLCIQLIIFALMIFIATSGNVQFNGFFNGFSVSHGWNYSFKNAWQKIKVTIGKNNSIDIYIFALLTLVFFFSDSNSKLGEKLAVNFWKKIIIRVCLVIQGQSLLDINQADTSS